MDAWKICFEFLLIFVVGILSGFGLGFVIFILRFEKMMLDLLRRSDLQLDIINDMLLCDCDEDEKESGDGE